MRAIDFIKEDVSRRDLLGKSLGLGVGATGWLPTNNNPGMPENRGQLFIKNINVISKNLGIEPYDLLKVIYYLSNNTTDISFGIIQFIPKTIKSLGYSVSDVEKMTPSEQLSLVYQYLKPFVKSGMSAGEIYLCVSLPSKRLASNNAIIGIENDRRPIIKNSNVSRGFLFNEYKGLVKNIRKMPNGKRYITKGDIVSSFNSQPYPSEKEILAKLK